MNEKNELTILEAAGAAGLSKNTAKYRLKKCPPGLIRKDTDGKIYVSAAGVAWLIKTTDGESKPPVYKPPEENINRLEENKPVEAGKNTSLQAEGKTGSKKNKPHKPQTENQSDYIKLLERTISEQSEQIRSQSNHIDNLLEQLSSTTQALQSAQEQASTAMALHAGTIQQNLLVSSDRSAAAGPAGGSEVEEFHEEKKRWWRFW